MRRLINILTIAILIGAPLCAYGQTADDDPVIRIFNKYEDREGVESVTISPALFGLMRNGNSGDDKTRELISKISGLRILTFDSTVSGGRATREALITELQTVVRRNFEEIMKVNSSGERVELYIQHNQNCRDCKSALLLINSDSNSVTVLHLAGTIDKTLIDAVMNGEIGLSGK